MAAFLFTCGFAYSIVNSNMSTPQPDLTLHKLQERVKELTALHKSARLLQDDERPMRDVLHDVVALLPAAWQYPDIATARVNLGDIVEASPGFRETKWMQSSRFIPRPGQEGFVQIAYLEERPAEHEGPFLAEERDLIDSLAEMIRSYVQHKLANENLELLVQERTSELRRLATELSLAEARKNREIAADLHDHVIQEFAFIKLRAQQFRGDAVFCGFENRFDEIIALLERAIQFTRRLTFEISTPILYELGLAAALEWLAEHYEQHHKLSTKVNLTSASPNLPEAVSITLFRCVQELLTNCVKYSQAENVLITSKVESHWFFITVQDDGIGFDTLSLKQSTAREAFGLFSIRERLRHFGGSMILESTIGKGTTVRLAVPVEAK